LTDDNWCESWQKYKNYICKKCHCDSQKKYCKTPKGKEARQRYSTTEKCRQSKRRYRTTEKGKEAEQRYRASEKGQKQHRQKQRRYHASPGGLNNYYKRKYDITLDEYNKLFESQKGRCAICARQPRTRRLTVNHDHSIEKEEGVRASIRGLLCMRCNKALGMFHDALNIIEQAWHYLKNPPARLILLPDN